MGNGLFKKLFTSQKGAALITMLLFLAVLTVVGLTSVSITSLENRTAESERIYETRINDEEAGVEPQLLILEETVLEGTIPVKYLPPSGPVITGSNLENEIIDHTIEADSPGATPDLKITLGPTDVSMDIDFLFTTLKAGSAIEFAAGNEGAGAGAGSGGVENHFQLVSEATVGKGNGAVTNHYICVVSGACQK